MSSDTRGAQVDPRDSGTVFPLVWQVVTWAIAVIHVVIGTLILLAILRQPDAANPWLRVDRYVIAFLVAGSVAAVGQAVFFLGGALRTMGFTEEMGLAYDPGILVFVAAAEVGKFATAVDYAHWHLVPGLEVTMLRAVGVVLAVIGATALVWTDRRLARHFSTAASAAQVVTDGPYRLVRHPRYTSVLLLALSVPLVFGSIFGWLAFAIIVMAVQHRIAREEPHLREMFGASYEEYASRTSRLLPGLY